MSFAQAVEANQRAILSLSQPDVTQILPILEEIREQTARVVSRGLRDSSLDDNFSAFRQRSMLAQLDRAIADGLSRLPRAIASQLRTGTRRAGRSSLERLRTMVEEGEARFGSAVQRLRIPVAKILLDVDRSVAARHSGSAMRYSGEIGARVRRDMAIGLVRGENFGQIARRLVGPIRYDRMSTGRNGPERVADAIADRQLFKSVSEAERLVRTEVIGGYNFAQLEGLQELERERRSDPETSGDDPWLKRWDATQDRRTCRLCASMDGEVRPMNQMFSCGVMWPPIHPNDRCGITPWRQGWTI